MIIKESEMNTVSQKLRKWLIKKGATPAEWSIYAAAREFTAPFQNGDLLRVYGTSKTNIRQHLARMIAKGLIIRHSYRTYLPAQPN